MLIKILLVGCKAGLLVNVKFSCVSVDKNIFKSKVGEHMEKDIDLKEIAKGFNMNVCGLATFMGYSKQALYQIFKSEQGVFTRRLYSALKLLKLQSDNIYDEELKKAKESKERREQNIQKMSEKINAFNVLK